MSSPDREEVPAAAEGRRRVADVPARPGRPPGHGREHAADVGSQRAEG